MNKEKITIGFKDQTGFRISECDITTGKVVVNGIEITSVEDWEKVTKSLDDLQQRIDKAKELSDEIYNFIKCRNSNLFYEIEDLLIKQDEILGGKE